MQFSATEEARKEMALQRSLNTPLRYLLALLPVLLTIGGWQLTLIAPEHFGCEGDIKHLWNCYLGSFNLLPVLAVGLFWLPLASLVTGPVSFALVVKMLVRDVAERREGRCH